MPKYKSFRNWKDEDEDSIYESNSKIHVKLDPKRRDKKKRAIQKARRQKARLKNEFFS